MSNNLAKDGSNHLAILPSLVMWTDGDLNPRPPRCKRGALPTELSALTVVCYNAKAATKPIPKSRRSDWS